MINKEPIDKSNKRNDYKSASRKVWPFLGAEEINMNTDNIILHHHPINRSMPVKTFLAPAEVHNKRNPSDENNESFHRAIGSILAGAQLFGVLPLYGVRSPSPQQLSFKIISPKTIYSISLMITLIFMAGVSITHMIKTLKADTFQVHGGIAAATAGAVFYGNSLFGLGLFMWLSPRWISLQKQWRSMELLLDRCKQSRPRLRWKFRVITIVIMTLALIEHVLSLIINFPNSKELPVNSNNTWKDYLRIYSFKSHAFMLSSLNYNLALGIFLFIISKIATFTWNFTDVFIMLVATGIAERYKSLNKCLLKSSKIKNLTIDWCEFREYYATLSILVKRADSDVSPVILLSFVNNLYFICLQLLNGLSRYGNAEHRVLFFFFCLLTG
ncbi:gustatory receptor for sugar taste 64e [Microplitis demolitor]|uniref:gustatory receptor for sugar taste 64e n=1 Tax=Microplitis demolitor TaxID=69319 RepID=UPI0006D4C725|nr:gustatory receptor for sugar taste 64e [Microplitis demolitor]